MAVTGLCPGTLCSGDNPKGHSRMSRGHYSSTGCGERPTLGQSDGFAAGYRDRCTKMGSLTARSDSCGGFGYVPGGSTSKTRGCSSL